MAARTQKPRTVVPFNSAASPALPAVCVGHVVGLDERGVLVDFAGNPGGPTPARLLAALDAVTLAAAAASRRAAALMFERGDPALPLLVGLVEATPVPGREATIDGKRIVLTGEEEIELRCGDASISLKKNGKLVIKGAYVETRARGTNRIKGGSVQIN